MSAAAALVHPTIETLAPFRRSPEARTPIPTRVTGEIPTWLRGDLVRTCPAVFASRGWRADHWFDALGMLYAFEIGEGSRVTFRSRLLESETARDASVGKSRVGTFGTPMARPLWQRIFQPIPRVTDNANVNIVPMGKELVAMTEGDRQLVVDEATLAAQGVVAYDDAHSGLIMSAHPHMDFERNRVVNVGTTLGAGGVLSIYEHAPESRQRKVVGAWKTRHVPYVHAFGLTAAHAILVAHPFVVKPIDMLWSNRGFIDHFAWRPEDGTKLVVLDRATGATREHLADPFFVFHTVNAFEDDGETVLDLLAYTDARILRDLRVDALVDRLPDLRPSLLRVRMRPGTERARVEPLTDVGFEFPATSYRRVNGKAYRFTWGASDGPPRGDAKGYTSSVVKIDLHTGASTAYGDDAHVFGEPIFVARPGAGDEDDGVLVTVGSRRDADTSVLAVIDAKTMALVASAEAPTAIPLGFHGSFLRSQS